MAACALLENHLAGNTFACSLDSGNVVGDTGAVSMVELLTALLGT